MKLSHLCQMDRKIFIILIIILVIYMDSLSPKTKKSTTTKPLTQTEQIETMLNLGDISEITPEANEDADRKIRKLELDLQEALRDVEVRDKQIQNLKKTQKHLENHQDLQRKKIASLEERVKTFQAEARRNKESQIAEVPDTAPLEAKIRELEVDNLRLKEENARLRKDLASKEESLSENEREVDKYRANNEDLTKKLKESEENFTKKLKESETNFSKKIKELQAKISSTPKVKTETIVDNKQVEALKGANQKLTTELAQTKSELQNIKKQVDRQTAEAERAEKKTKAIEKDLADATKAKESLKKKIVELQEGLKNISVAKKSDKNIPINQQISVNPKEEEDDEESIPSAVEEKQTKKILKSVFEANLIMDPSQKIRVLNNIIANAQSMLDLINDDDSDQ